MLFERADDGRAWGAVDGATRVYRGGVSEVAFEFDAGGDLAAYSLRPKRSALYRLDRAQRAVAWDRDLPGCGDTAFPAVRRTGIYLLDLRFVPEP